MLFNNFHKPSFHPGSTQTQVLGHASLVTQYSYTSYPLPYPPLDVVLGGDMFVYIAAHDETRV